MKKLTLILTLLSVWAITNAQTDENFILSTDDVQKNELIVTPEIEEMVVTKIKNILEESHLTKNSQLEYLHIGKPIPLYEIINEKKEAVYTYNVSLVAGREPLSLRFTNTWSVPVMSDGAPLLFGMIQFSDFKGGKPYIGIGNENTIKHFHNYEHKDFVIGSVGVNPSSIGMDHLIIRKENKDVFVKVYDEATGEYFKNECSLNDIINFLRERAAKEEETQRRYFDKIANKSELEITPEIKEMVVNAVINSSDKVLSNFRIKSRSQLENLLIVKPIPEYWIDYDSEKLIFAGNWNVPVISSNGEPLVLVMVRLTEDEQYSLGRTGATEMAYRLHNFKDKNLIIGTLGIRSSLDYLIIRKEHKDIFVEMYDYATREYFVNEYSLSEIINLLKK